MATINLRTIERVTDDLIDRGALFGRAGYQQPVNAICRRMIERGEVERRGSGDASDPFTYHLPKAF